MSQNKEWFTDRIGQVISQFNPESNKTEFFDIDTVQDAEQAFIMQENHSFIFTEAKADDQGKVCIGCEG